MCGLAVIFSYADSAPPVDRREIVEIRDAMLSRGPDGEGLWMAPNALIGLVHRRLSIIDLSDAASQPMSNADGSLRIVFNGEIYNHRVLRAELERKGRRFRSNSDTEVLLHLYAEKGSAMVHDLRGMYAFVIWDDANQTLFAARDPFGIKPLYFADDGRTLRLASQVKALLCGGRIDTAPEPAGHFGFMLWGYVPEPYTLYKHIRELPAGSTLTLRRRGRANVAKFCDVAEELAHARCERPETREETARRLRDALRDSVAHHLIADVPVGVFLSSGLDSTTVAALASELKPHELRTITLGFREFRDTPFDETIFAEQVARRYGTSHHTHLVSSDDFFAELDSFLKAMDQPSTDAVNTYFVSMIAKRSGLKVALSGLGGDELFGGYPSFRQIPRLVGALRPVPVSLGSALRAITAPLIARIASAKYAGVLEYGGSYGGAYLLRRALFMPWEVEGLLDPDFARQGWQQLQPMVGLEEIGDLLDGGYARIAAFEMRKYMRCQLLRDADWAGMAHSVEIRTPMIDIELLRAIAPLLTGSDPPGKTDMAATPAKPLPNEIILRPKSGFTVPVNQWLMRPNGVGHVRQAGLQRGLRRWALKVYASYTGWRFGDRSHGAELSPHL
jgi:asparagine synthase (glutamine-hydrolysing)